jgi:hypothetical protein
MPRPNRVAPTGERFATPARGLLMGNRGCLVDAGGAFTARRWTTRAWICCRLDFAGRRRPVAPPGRWTALFFLDEATALAAGHRPCGACRRAALAAFRAAIGAAARDLRALDAALHAERTAPARPCAALGALPDGAMALVGGAPWLLAGGAARPWTPAGYGPPRRLDPAARHPVLTPALALAALAGGYCPLLHPSARASAASCRGSGV